MSAGQDPHDEALERVAELGRHLLTATEIAVRITSTHARAATSATGRLHAARPREGVTAAPTALVATKHAASTHAASTAPLATAVSDPRAGSAAPPPSPSPRSDLEQSLVAVHRDAAAYFRDTVRNSWVPRYLEQRSLTEALGEPWGAGYAPGGWTHLTDHLRGKGWSDDTLLKSGLSRRSRTGNLIDHFRDRLVLPLRDGRGDVVAFVGRCREGAENRAPKYLNTAGTAIYNKSSVVFGLSEGGALLAAGAVPVLTEGPFDAIAVSAAGGGRYVGLATCGTSLTEGHVQALTRVVPLSERLLLVATDQDPAGDKAAARAFERLAVPCGDVRRVNLPRGLDPAQLLRADGSTALLDAVSGDTMPLITTAIDARLNRWRDQLQWVQGRVRAARHVAPLIALLTESKRSEPVTELASRLDLLPSTVAGLVSEALAAGRQSTQRDRSSPSPIVRGVQSRPPPEHHPYNGPIPGRSHGR